MNPPIALQPDAVRVLETLRDGALFVDQIEQRAFPERNIRMGFDITLLLRRLELIGFIVFREQRWFIAAPGLAAHRWHTDGFPS